jgi:hypothetical protein
MTYDESDLSVIFCFSRNMFSDLPKELIDEILGYDPTKRFHFDKVVHQLRMRQVWYEITRYSLFPAEKWILHFGSQWVMTAEMFEDHVVLQRRWHRILGKKPRLVFNKEDLLANILGI